jgi:hypothetical protein
MRSKGAKARFVKAFDDGQKKVVEKKRQQDARKALKKRMQEEKPAFVSKKSAMKFKHPGSLDKPDSFAEEVCPYLTDDVDACKHAVQECADTVCEGSKFFDCSQSAEFIDCIFAHLPLEDVAEKACNDYYPEQVDECLNCGEKCYHELGCESIGQCLEQWEFHDCHMNCMPPPPMPPSFSSSSWSSSWDSSSSWDPTNDPYVREQCEMFYGEGVDVGQCVDCGYDCYMKVPEEVWMSHDPEDHMQAMEDIMMCSDECMGKKNSFTVACQDQADHMGIELDLSQCLGCGMMCGCDANHCDEQCHAECMGFGHSDEGSEEAHDEGAQMCKDFYGENVDVDQCLQCGDDCYMEAATYATSEADFFVLMLACTDRCIGYENEATQLCRNFGGFNDSGENGDLAECFACGMECCESVQECKQGHKDQCMHSCIPHDGTDLIQTKKLLKK